MRLLSFPFAFEVDDDSFGNMVGNDGAPGAAFPRTLESILDVVFLRENVRDNDACSPKACFFAFSLADFHLSRACAVSLACRAAASLDFAFRLSRVERT